MEGLHDLEKHAVSSRESNDFVFKCFLTTLVIVEKLE